jgi:shikimate kinase/3-dehydroquinate synthase
VAKNTKSSRSSTKPSICFSIAGPPGVGKSKLGRTLHDLHGLNWADLDECVERRSGRTVPEIIGQDGESAFRQQETEALENLDANINVLSLGGGSLTQAQTRKAARERGLVFGLGAPLETIRSRLQQSPIDRPLLRPKDSEDDPLAALIEKRQSSYAAVDIVLDCESTASQVADTLLHRARETSIIRAQVGEKHSRVLVGANLASAVCGAVLNLAPTRPVIVISDAGLPESKRSEILDPIRALLPLHEILGPGGEQVKSWEYMGRALNEALINGAGRQSVVIGLGGGATCDLAGLIAALLGRGAPLVMVPSTVVSQVDASVGGKTAVNMASGRNLVGSFYPAHDVIVDVDLLESLDEAEYRSGLAEVLKMGVITDPDLFEQVCRQPKLSPHTVARAIQHKASIVARDPFESGERKKLNLGHTLAHALESASQFKLRHGDAVAMGLAAIARLSTHRGWSDKNTCTAILEGLSKAKLPTFAPESLLSQCGRYLGQDKKSDSKFVDLIIVRKLGETEVMRLELQQIIPDLIRFGGQE